MRSLIMKNEKSNMKIVVIGGTGLIGSKVVTKLGERGYEVVAASPTSGVNTLTGEGLAVVRGYGGYGVLRDINSQLAHVRSGRRCGPSRGIVRRRLRSSAR